MKIKVYKISARSSDAKGTVNNPYTEAEFESMLNDGTWQGGFVENRGYCAEIFGQQLLSKTTIMVKRFIRGYHIKKMDI